MNNEEKILSMLEQLTGDVSIIKDDVSGLKTRMDTLDTKVDKLDARVDKLDAKVDDIDRAVIRIENEHGDKLAALEDGRKMNYQLLKQIEKKVSGQEDFILRRVFSNPS